MKLSKTDREDMRAKRNSSGLTMIELLFVMGIIIVLVAIAVPSVMNFVQGFRLRTAAAAMETLVQDTRMRSVRDDAIYSMAQITVNSGMAGFCVVNPVALATPGGPAVPTDCLQGEQTIAVPTNVQVITEANAPAVVPQSTLYTQLATTPLVSVTFNARGLPCQYNPLTGVCSTLPAGLQVGYVTYFATTPPRGSTIYRAVTVTPAGRVRIWANQAGAWQ